MSEKGTRQTGLAPSPELVEKMRAKGYTHAPEYAQRHGLTRNAVYYQVSVKRLQGLRTKNNLWVRAKAKKGAR
jgi:hypothetical protein